MKLTIFKISLILAITVRYHESSVDVSINTKVDSYISDGPMKLWTIVDFLPLNVANDFHFNLENAWNNESWLFATNLPNQNTKIRSRENIMERKALALSTRAMNGFAYAKYELDTGNQEYLFAKGVFGSEKNMKSISKHLDSTLTALTDGFFISSYTDGSFLTLHSDVNLGKYAFVYSLTKDWNREDGGILRIFCNGVDAPPCVEVVPSFNKLIVFAVRPDTLWHDVSIVETATKRRYSVTGWWQTQDDGFTEDELRAQREQRGTDL